MPKFKVTGLALVPVEVVMEIEAPTSLIAMKAADVVWARSRDKKQFVVVNSHDGGAVHGFRASEAVIADL